MDQFLAPAVSLSLSIYLYLSLFLSLPISISFSQFLFLYICLTIDLSLSLYVNKIYTYTSFCHPYNYQSYIYLSMMRSFYNIDHSQESGLGREGSRHGIEEYTDLKYMCFGGL